ncbi:MAG: hypothetical protein M1818_004941 [Claussenomyces sp. TS43310]|nr:MAG: hypothetical protein M1818_004941 [Claussenomyces sp. TS43310]
MTKFSAEVLTGLQKTVEGACADAGKGLPGTTVVVVGKDGKELFAHAAGKRGYGSAEPMTLDNIYWIASCTKMITGVACMQLVERGVLTLDDVAQVEALAPELKAVKVLQKDGTLVEKKRGITLRMLLTHTAGFGYSFFNEKLRDFSKPIGYEEFSGHFYDFLQPLVNQPGETWEYGINIDWAGILLERVTGQSLNNYMHQHIFKPLGLENVSMFPTKAMKEKLVHMNYRRANGTVTRNDHIFRRPLIVERQQEIESCFNSGGAGCFAKPQEYCRKYPRPGKMRLMSAHPESEILAVLLNDGTSPTTGAQLLKKDTVDEMFRNQISNIPHFGRQGIPAAKPELTNEIADLYPVAEDVTQGWGLTFMTTGGATGRSPGTVQWAGLPNLWWWCDREKGVAGMVCAQIFPFADATSIGLWVEVEKAVYKAL